MAITKVPSDMIQVANNVTDTTVGGANSAVSLTFDSLGVISAASNVALQVNSADIASGAVTDAKIASDITLSGNTTVDTLVAGAGTNTAPSITTSGDTNTGIFFPSADTMTLTSGGADIATVNSSGITMAAGKTLPASALTGSLPAGMGGKILQVVQDVKTDTFSTNSQAFVDVTGLSVSITPSSASNKILVMVSLALGNNGTHSDARLMRNSTPIAIGDASSNRTRSTFHLSSVSNTDIPTPSMTWLDSPATTSAVTYKMQVAVPYSSSYVIYVNRGADDSDAGYAGRLVSTITVMEVAA